MSNEVVVYVYQNIGSFGIDATLGRVVGYMNVPLTTTAYVYVNQLEQASGATRLMEDGATRHLEDGTTERTLE